MTVHIYHGPFYFPDSSNVEVTSDSLELEVPWVGLDPEREVFSIVGNAGGSTRIPNYLCTRTVEVVMRGWWGDVAEVQRVLSS